MKYKFRSGASPGSWYCFLLPLSLAPLAFFASPSSESLYLLLFGLSLFTCLCRNFVTKKAAYSLQENNAFILLFSIPIIQILYFFISAGSLVLCIAVFMVFWYYIYIVKTLLTSFPGSFTLGEARILGQGIMLFLFCCIVVFLRKLDIVELPVKPGSIQDYIICLQVLIIGTLLLIHTLHLLPVSRQGICFGLSCFIAGLLMMYVGDKALRKSIFLFIIEFCVTFRRIALIFSWCVSTMVSVLFVILINSKKKEKASTIIRKFFHLIIIAVYVPGMVYDLQLLRLASGIALATFVLLELCRILKIPVIGATIQDAFQIFLDEKDSGELILTHIYLLIGCSCPIWLAGYNSDLPDKHISLLSGILSVGCGDTAAAVGGSLFGSLYWKGSKKTWEGTACAFIVQSVVSLFFLKLWHPFVISNIVLVLVSAFVTSIMEALTTQVDNLVLPLITFTFLAWI